MKRMMLLILLLPLNALAVRKKDIIIPESDSTITIVQIEIIIGIVVLVIATSLLISELRKKRK